jgi:photosystem II stability/assembly factor-like uncharacterized protein
MKLSLRTAVVGLVSLVATGAVVACATDDAQAPAAPPPDVIPTPDGGADASADGAASEAGDGGAQVDCSKTAFCVAPAPVPSFVSLNAVWGSSPTDLWVVGTRGTILHGDGTTFTAVDWSPDPDAGVDTDTIFFSVWGVAKDDVWVGASGAPLHYSIGRGGAPAWEEVEGSIWDGTSASQGRIAAIWGSAKDGLWIAGSPSWRFNGYGSFWSSGTDPDGNFVWNAVDAYEGDFTSSPTLHAIWGAGPNDVFAVGGEGKAFRYVPPPDEATPARWTELNTFTTVPLDGIWGSSASDVWAVGGDGTLRHFTGDATQGFAVVDTPTNRALHGITGTGPSDIWAVGDGGTVLHFDGHTWKLADSGLAPGQSLNLFGVWASGPSDVWIAGEGVLLHRSAMNGSLP